MKLRKAPLPYIIVIPRRESIYGQLITNMSHNILFRGLIESSFKTLWAHRYRIIIDRAISDNLWELE